MHYNEILIKIFLFRTIRLLIMITWATFFAFAITKTTKRKRPLGVTILAIVLMSASIHKLFGFTNYEYYKIMFQHLPQNLIIWRYIGSIFLRVAGIAIGIGLLLMKNFFRKAVIVIAIYTIITIPFKHQLETFHNIATFIEQKLAEKSPEAAAQNFSHDPFTKVAVMLFGLIDLVFSLILIFYFRRSKIRFEFEKKISTTWRS